MTRKRSPLAYLPILLMLTGCSQATPPLPPTLAAPSPLSASTATQTQTAILTTSPITPAPKGTEGYPWWNDSVFYEIFVRSFYDSNGDGIGDFDGVTEKLGYLGELGITGIYLMPVFPTSDPSGYQVLDYNAVNTDYGTLDDFRHLVSEAHRCGIRVVIDFPINGTSIRHPWFVASRDPFSPYRNWYVWADADPGYLGAWGQQVWHKSASGYFYSALDERIAELNFANPEVTTAIQQSFRLWLEQGVDGFRLDAVKHLIEEGQVQLNTASTHDWLRRFREFVKDIDPDAVIVGEVWETDPTILSSYTQGDELDLAFDFAMSHLIIDSAQTGTNIAINSALRQRREGFPRQRLAPFITNHDMDRATTQLDNDVERARVAASLLLTSPGVPFIYFGEEIGMPGETAGYSQACQPMQWSQEVYAGFSSTAPWSRPWCDPTVVTPSRNVLDEMLDADSLLSHYRRLIHLRNSHTALRIGDLYVLSSGNPGVYASLRVSSTEAILIIVNLTRTPVGDYSLSLERSTLPVGEYTVSTLMGEGSFGDLTVNIGGRVSQYGSAAPISSHSTAILALYPK